MATYPSSIVSFATHNSGDIVQPGDVNTPNAEIVAVETGLLSGFQHDLLPLSDDSRSLGSVSKRWLKAWLQDIDSDGTATLAFVNVSSTLTPASLVDISGASAGQIKFPAVQNASANANTLDDYEEVSWTPVIGGDGGTSGQSYSAQRGQAIKVGQMVMAQFEVVLTGKGTITGNVQIQGLPFTSAATASFIQAGSGVVDLFTNLNTTWTGPLSLRVGASSTAAFVSGTTVAATGVSNLATGDITNTTVLRGTVMYRAGA